MLSSCPTYLALSPQPFLVEPSALKKRPQLQAELSEPFYQRSLHTLAACADPLTQQRLNSLRTPHATAWTSWTSPLTPLSNAQRRYALRWILGLPFCDAPYPCPDCGQQADPLGIHATTCQRSGEISRGHTCLRDCVGGLFESAGVQVSYEYSSRIPNSSSAHSSRPADIAVRWHGKRLAIDFMVVTPVRSSARPGEVLLDQGALGKSRKNLAPCAAEGLVCQPFWPIALGRSDLTLEHWLVSL